MSDTDNMIHWQKLCQPPEWAIKPIQAGRLKGKSDINPQWRMMAMTDTFGPCGTGWKYSIDKLWLEKAAAVKSREGNVTAEEVTAFALVSVCYKVGEHWSEPIPGIGGSMLTEMEKSGPYNSDEAYKMAVTDALSVAFKALGVAANIYSGDRFDGSKYSRTAEVQQRQSSAATPQANANPADQACYARIQAALKAIYGDDNAAKKAKLIELTTWTKDGKTIAGNPDYRKKTGAGAEILAKSLEKLVPKQGEEPPTCTKCAAILVDGKCPVCPPF